MEERERLWGEGTVARRRSWGGSASTPNITFGCSAWRRDSSQPWHAAPSLASCRVQQRDRSTALIICSPPCPSQPIQKLPRPASRVPVTQRRTGHVSKRKWKGPVAALNLFACSPFFLHPVDPASSLFGLSGAQSHGPRPLDGAKAGQSHKLRNVGHLPSPCFPVEH